MKIYTKIKAFIDKWGRYIQDLFTDVSQNNGNVRKMSLHRVILIVLVGVAIGMWVGGGEIPGTMLTFLLTITGVVFGDKALSAIKTIKGVGSSDSTTTPTAASARTPGDN